MSLPTDTSVDFELVTAGAYRQMSMRRKWEILGRTFAEARSLHAAGVRLREGVASPGKIKQDWLATNYGYRGALAEVRQDMDEQEQNLSALRDVARVLTQFGIPYALGGSMASSLHGVARFTRDADLLVEPFAGKEQCFAAALGQDYYLSLPAMLQAVAQRSSFNILNTSQGFKVDLFIRKDLPFEASALNRRLEMEFPGIPGEHLAVLTAEDVLLFKMQWFQLGDGVSTQQWNDVLGILRVQEGRLDNGYLDKWSLALGVTDLLARSRAETGLK